MKGEEEDWYRLASHIKTSIQRCKQETSASDFIKWMEYLRRDVNAFHREDYYLANIAKEIRATKVKDPRRLRIEDFIIPFKFVRKGKLNMSMRTAKEKANQMKSQFLSWAGIKKKKD